jgi:potassium channel
MGSRMYVRGLGRVSDPRRWWQEFLIVLVLDSAWVSPFELAIHKSVTAQLLVVDIALFFFVAYVDRSTNLFVDDRRKIASRYM